MVRRFKDDTPDVPSRSNLRGQKFEGVGRWDPVMVLLGIVFMVLFPAFVTIIAPTSRISLAYDGKNISASVQSLVFLTIPYRTTRLANVTDVSTGFSAGVVERDHSVQGESSEVRTEDSASLTLSGAGPDLRVMVSPVNIRVAAQ